MIIDTSLKEELKDSLIEVPANTVRSVFQENTNWSHIQLLLIDSKYHALSTDNWQKVLNTSNTKAEKYLTNYYDCNHFAFLFKAEVGLLLVNSVGLVLNFSGHHAFNSVLICDTPGQYEFKFIEPQADRFIQLKDNPIYGLQGQGLIII